MPTTIKLLAWNIYKFSNTLAKNTTRINLVLDLIKNKSYDLFVIIEPTIANGKLGKIATGSGVDGIKTLRAALKAKTGVDWQVVPPLVLAEKTKRETLAIFFNPNKLKLKGPVDDTSITSGDWKTTLTKGTNGTFTGQYAFKDTNNNAIAFPAGTERRPYLATFQAGNKLFSIIALHSPSPKYSGTTAHNRNLNARQGTQKLGAIKELLNTKRAHPIIVVGDFNCCNPGHPHTVAAVPCGQGTQDSDKEARTPLVNQGFTSHVSTGSSLQKADCGIATSYTNHAFDYLLTANGGGTNLTVQNAKVLGLADLTTGFNVNLNKTKFKPIFKRVRSAKGSGISDHLPVSAEITI